ncbi:MAG: haloalkane dehalogenase [Panacagrimonas sp.]
MSVLRTPDARFVDLPDFPYAPKWVDDLPGYDALRMHYVDEGQADQPVALCLHGQPTWGYLYRKLIPPLRAAGYHVVVPDLFGFGRSDKPADDAVYTFDFHRHSLLRFIERLGLRGALLVCQDWGGVLGLTLPMDLPGAFSKLLVMNTTLATGDVKLTDGFLAWRAFNNSRPDLDVAALMKRSIKTLADAEAQAYAAPFPDVQYKAGVRRFPNLVPEFADSPGAEVSRRAREWWRTQWSGRSFMAIGTQDPVLGLPVMKGLRRQIRGCPEPLELADAGHFVQEAGAIIVERAMQSFAAA